jgi:hypothetical protein
MNPTAVASTAPSPFVFQSSAKCLAYHFSVPQ